MLPMKHLSGTNKRKRSRGKFLQFASPSVVITAKLLSRCGLQQASNRQQLLRGPMTCHSVDVRL